METIEISDFNQLAQYAEKLPHDLDWFKSHQFTFSRNISGIKIHIKGERFDSSMSTTIMRSVLKLQEAIYRQYSLYVYGEVRRLSQEERATLEIYAKVEPGSSILELIPEPIIKAVAEKINTMTTGQFLIGIATVALASTLCVVTGKILDYKKKIKEMEIQKETLSGIQKTFVESQIEATKAMTDFYKEITKQTGVQSLEINGENIDSEKIKVALASPREKKENSQKVISGAFKVTDIHILDRHGDSAKDISLDIIDEKGEVYKDVNVLEGLIDQNDYQMLKDSTNKKFMNMKIVVTRHGDKTISVFLNSLEK